MSNPPSQQWNYSAPDDRYIDPRTPASYEEYQGPRTAPSHPYSAQEPPRFLFPDSQNYDPPIPESRFFRPWDSGSDPRPSISSTSTGPRYSASSTSTDPRHSISSASTGPRYSVSSNSTGPRYSVSSSSTGPRYSVSSSSTGPRPSISSASTDSLNVTNNGVQRLSISKGPEYAGGPYYDPSSYGRGSIGSGERITDVDSQYSNSSTAFSSPVHSEHGSAVYSSTVSSSMNLLQKQQQRLVTSGIPSGFDKLLHHSPAPLPPPQLPSTSRFHLHIRQHPIAARACGAGDRDRRPVDPPPIIQMLLTDFDPHSQDDKGILQDPRFTVGCLLCPVTESSWPGSPAYEGSVNQEDRLNRASDNAPGRSTPLLSGKSFVSPFFVEEDPDPDTAPIRPTSQEHKADTELGLSKGKEPAAFFIFSDLSIRSAGVYRLQFRLMNWGDVEDRGQSMPILAEVWSDPFRVYPAKDFPGMRDSSALTEGLKELGFVELKTRGNGKGKGRKR